jgi:hypothetical protein
MTGRSRPKRSRAGWLGDESGAAIIETLMAMGMALITTAFLMNGLLMLYARSVIQYAADSGARAGALSGGTGQVCKETAEGIISGLANIYQDSTEVKCNRKEALTTAEIAAQLRPVFPSLGPSWSFAMRATSVTEPVP